MPPRARRMGLGGLPDIESGGIDPMDIFKMAQIMESINASEAQRGTPDRTIKGRAGTPDITSSTKPFMAGIRGYQEVSGSAPFLSSPSSVAPSVPFNGMEGDPSTGVLEEAQGRLIMGQPSVGGGQSTWVKPGRAAIEDQVIPGTPGSTELANKQGMLHLLTPDSAKKVMNERGYKNMEMAGKATAIPAFYNDQTGGIKLASEYGSAEAAAKEGFHLTTMETAIKEAGDLGRSNVSARGQSHADILRLYAETLRIRPGQRSDADNAILKTLKKRLPEILGEGGAVAYERKSIEGTKKEYKARKVKALDLIRQNQESSESSEIKAQKIRGILDMLHNDYGDEVYDILPTEEKKLLKGKGWFN